MSHLWRGFILVALSWLSLTAVALAHEVRPALLQIVERPAGGYDVTWKQPVVGDMAIRLAPHLSGGALDRAPDSQAATAGYLLKTWRIAATPPLDGQTIEIRGLTQTVTDVLIRVKLRSGREVSGVVRPADPTFALSLSGPKGMAVPGYLRLGVEHILTGPDHLLFVLGLLLLIGPGWQVVKAISAFTVAHSITLAIAALGYLAFPSAAIEALVALSILFVACELVRTTGEPTLARRWPWLIAFTFGLLHGLAFAGALAEIGLPPDGAPLALLLFNVGVEIGQLAFIAAALGVMSLVRPLLRRLPDRTGQLVRMVPAYVIGGVSAYWLIERTLAAI